MPFGCCNTILIDVEDGSGSHTSASDMSTLATVVMIENQLFVTAIRVTQIHMVFSSPNLPQDEVFLDGEHFIFPPQHKVYNSSVQVITTAAGINMFILHRHFRNNHQCMGDIYPPTAIQDPVNITPIFGEQMDQHIECNNLLDILTRMNLETKKLSTLC